MYYTPLLFVFFCLLQENAEKENHESFFPPTKQDDFFVRQQNEETGTSRNLWTLTFEISSSRVLLPVMAIAVKSFQPERNLFPGFQYGNRLQTLMRWMRGARCSDWSPIATKHKRSTRAYRIAYSRGRHLRVTKPGTWASAWHRNR